MSIWKYIDWISPLKMLCAFKSDVQSMMMGHSFFSSVKGSFGIGERVEHFYEVKLVHG